MTADNRGVIWARVSSQEQKDSGFSLDSQERSLTEFAKQKNIEVVRIFKQAEQASTANKRREFQHMLAFIEKEKIPFLIAEKTDRIVRNLSDPAALNELMSKGLTVHLVKELPDMGKDSPPHVGLTFGIMCAVAAYIAKLIGRESLKGMEEKAKQGGTPFICPIGYVPIADPNDPKGSRRTIKVDEKRGPLITTAFKLYSSGRYSIATLTTEMRRLGLNTRPALTWPKAGRGSQPITTTHMAKILINPFYTGEIHWNGGIYKGNHHPLVSRALYNSVQKALHAHCTYVRPETKKQFAFRPWATCGACWRPLKAEEQTGSHKSGRYTYYHCRRPGCSNRQSYREGHIERMVVEALGDLYIDDALAAKIRQHLQASAVEQTAAEKATLTRLQAEETRRTNQRAMLYDDRLSKLITADHYKAKAAEIDEALDEIKRQRERLGQTNQKFREEGSAIIDMMRSVKAEYMAATPERKAVILGAILDKVVLRPNDHYVTFREPFGQLFGLHRVMTEAEKGE